MKCQLRHYVLSSIPYTITSHILHSSSLAAVFIYPYVRCAYGLRESLVLLCQKDWAVRNCGLAPVAGMRRIRGGGGLSPLCRRDVFCWKWWRMVKWYGNVRYCSVVWRCAYAASSAQNNNNLNLEISHVLYWI